MFLDEEAIISGYLCAGLSGHSSHVGGIAQVDRVFIQIFNMETTDKIAVDIPVIDRLLNHERRALVLLPQPGRSMVGKQESIVI
jgi:hypothetical protein